MAPLFRTLSGCFGIVALVVAAGCREGSEPPIDTSDPGNGDTDEPDPPVLAGLRLANLSVGATGALTFGVDDADQEHEVAEGEGTAYFSVEAGLRVVSAMPPDGPEARRDELLLTEDASFSVTAIGDAGPDGGSTLQLVALDDGDAPSSGDRRARWIHAATERGAIEVWATDAECGSLSGEEPSALHALGAVSAVGALPADVAGVALAEPERSERPVCLRLPAQFTAGLANLYVVDGPDNPRVVAQLDDGSLRTLAPYLPRSGHLRFAHVGRFASTGTSWLQPHLDGDPLGAPLSVRSGTDFVEVPDGPAQIAFWSTAFELEGPAAELPELDIRDGSAWSIVALGAHEPRDGEPPLQLRALPYDIEGLELTRVRYAIHHAAPASGAGRLDVWPVDSGCLPNDSAPTVRGLAFGERAVLADRPAGTLRVGLDLNRDGIVEHCFAVPPLGEGAQIDLHVFEQPSGNLALLAHLPDGTTTVVASSSLPKAALRFMNVAHLADDTAPLRVFLNGRGTDILLGSLQGSRSVEVTGGTYVVDFVPDGEPIDASIAQQPDLVVGDGAARIVYAAGYVDPPTDLAEPATAIGLVDPIDRIGVDQHRLTITLAAAAEAHRKVDVWMADQFCNGVEMLLSGAEFGWRGQFDLGYSALTVGVTLDSDGSGGSGGGTVPMDLCYELSGLPAGQLTSAYLVSREGSDAWLALHAMDGSVTLLGSVR